MKIIKSYHSLRDILKKINGKGYKAYKQIAGKYDFKNFCLTIDHVQGDPFSTPSRMRAVVKSNDAGFPYDTTSSKVRAIALSDYLTRQFFQNCKKKTKGKRGLGNSGLITIYRPLQEILCRSAMVVTDKSVEARFFVGLPASGRNILGKDAGEMLLNELPQVVEYSLFFSELNSKAVYEHIETAEDASFLRDRLDRMGLVSFIANGSLLPRASGIDPKPLAKEDSTLFASPDPLAVDIDLPNRGTVTGMGIPKGVSLIVGGGYHGKSTLLNGIELGIYNHIPGDGRELAVTVEGAVKIRASDGRNIQNTDISPFINNLPYGKDTIGFSTENASGSTSQAASISEAIEAGSNTLLLDEDTSATNFMIRDHRMQRLVSKNNEPITPFVDKVGYLYSQMGISTILVMGGSGDYFSVADHVVQMTGYLPYDVTKTAHRIADEVVTGREEEGGDRFGNIRHRIIDPRSINPLAGNSKVKIAPRGRKEILFGRNLIKCPDLEQIVEDAQTKAVGYAIYYATRYMDAGSTLETVLDKVMADIENRGLDILTPWTTGDLSSFRVFELAAAINRMRGLKASQK